MARSKRKKAEEEEEGEEEEFVEEENKEKDFEKLVELVEKFSKSSATTTTSTSIDADVVVAGVGLSYSEFKELVLRINGFVGSLPKLLASIPPKLRQVALALYRHAIVYYDPSIGAWRVDFLRLRQRVKVLRTSAEVQHFYLSRQPVTQSVAPTTQLQQAELVEETIKAAEADNASHREPNT